MPSYKTIIALRFLDIFRRFFDFAEEKHEVKIMNPRLMTHTSIKDTTINEFREAVQEGQ